jgi:hypothetical protein
VGEDRGSTEGDGSRDRPGDEMVRLNVAEAAQRLGISEAGVRKRLQRGQIPYERDDDGRLFVWVSPAETRHAASREEAEESRDTTALLEEMRERLRYVEGQLEAERQAHGETRRLLLSALEKIPPTIEAPGEPSGAAEVPGGPSEATEQPGRVEPQHSIEAADEMERAGRASSESAMGGGSLRRPWWRQMFRS